MSKAKAGGKGKDAGKGGKGKQGNTNQKGGKTVKKVIQAPKVQSKKGGKQQDQDFNYIVRMLNTNLDGRLQLPYAVAGIKGIGRRMGMLMCRILNLDDHRKAGDLSEEEREKVKAFIIDPAAHGVPTWFLNRQRDITDGNTMQLTSTMVDTYLCQDLELWKKIRSNRGLRHYWRIRVRGQKNMCDRQKRSNNGVTKKK